MLLLHKNRLQHICVYLCMYSITCVYVWVCMQIMCVCVCVRVYANHVCMWVCVCVCMQTMCVCMCVCVCLCVCKTLLEVPIHGLKMSFLLKRHCLKRLCLFENVFIWNVLFETVNAINIMDIYTSVITEVTAHRLI